MKLSFENFITPKNSPSKNEYTGMWQAPSHIPAEYCDRFILNEDGTFEFKINKLCGADREPYYAGSWEIKDSQLILTVKEKIITEGGVIVKALKYSGSGYAIEGIYKNHVKLDKENYEIREYKISEITLDEELKAQVINIDGFDYYNFYNGKVIDFMNKNVYELGEYAAYINEQTDGECTLIMQVKSIPDPHSDDVIKRNYYHVYVGKNHQAYTVNWDWFLVSKDFSEVCWYDISTWDVLTLGEWRESPHYRKLQ